MADNIPTMSNIAPYVRNPPLVQLAPYQREIANFAIMHQYCGLFLAMGSGKAVDDTTPVARPDGTWTPIGKIQPGDYVINALGQKTQVLKTWHHKNKTAYRVTLSDGRSFVCCDEHLIPYRADTEDQNITCKPLGDMLDDYRIVHNDGHISYSYRIPHTRPVVYPTQDLPVDPYYLGVILGSGYLMTLPLMTDVLSEHTTRKIKDTCHLSEGTIYPNPVAPVCHFDDTPGVRAMAKTLRGLGLSGISSAQKGIPDLYLRGDIQQRKDLLSGLIDTTTISARRISDTVEIKLSLPSQRLAKQTEKLAWSLGYGATISSKVSKTDLYPSATVTIVTQDCTLADNIDMVSTESSDLTDAISYDADAICSIVPVESRDMTCLTVDSPDHCYLLKDYVVTHNTLITLETLYELNPPCHVLVIGPKPVVRSTWVSEIEKWHFPFHISSLITDDAGKQYSRNDRVALYKDIENRPPALWFLNRELVSDLVNNLPKTSGGAPRWPFGMVVLDEAQAFKSNRSKRFKALAKVRPQIWRLIELTGTPTPNGLLDLWALIYLLDQGARLGNTMTIYRNSWFNANQYVNGRPVKWNPVTGASDMIYRRISDITISFNNLGSRMPQVIFNDVPVYLDDDERAIYKEMLNEQVLAFSDGELTSVDDLTDDPVDYSDTSTTAAPKDVTASGEHVAEAVNAAVLQAKLSQLASGAIYVDKTHDYVEVHTKKIDALLSVIENTPGPVLVAYHFKSDLDMIMKYLPEAGVEATPFDGSPGMVNDWNARKIPVMLVQPASAGHGLNLQYGGSTLVWYTLPWSLEEYLQTNARLARQGQAQPVIIHHLLCQGTIDSRILRALKNKNTSQKELLDSIALTIQDAKNPDTI